MSVQLFQARLAKTFGVGQTCIFKYEQGETTVPAEMMLKYADMVDVSLDYLYGRTDDSHGMYYECKLPKVEKSYPEIENFVKMCFEPRTAMNERLKETLRGMMKEAQE